MALQYTSSRPDFYTPEGETNGQNSPDGNHDYFSHTGVNYERNAFVTGSWSSWTSVINDETGSNWFNGNPGVGRDAANEYHLSSSTAEHTFSRLGSNSTGTGGGSRGGDIRMGALLLYNRVLSEEEIKQNLDVLDRRFR